jgi:7-cyano-7-deazaguanine reductase
LIVRFDLNPKIKNLNGNVKELDHFVNRQICSFWRDTYMNKNFDHTLRYKADPPGIIKADVLEAADYAYAGQRDITITINQPEFTSVCPMTGLPDFGMITIDYSPDQKIIELKSLKYYLLQYRNVGIFYEHAINRVLDDLVAVLSPKQMEVKGKFSARGGLTAMVTAKYEEAK